MTTRRAANLKVWVALLAAVAAAAMVVALDFANPARAANAGDLDANFDGNGRLVFDVFGGVGDIAEAVAIQPDGKIVLAGSWCGFGAQCHTGTFALARFNPDGSLDSAFGNNGRTLVAFPNGWAEAQGVAIQADGRIVAVGERNDDDGVGDGDFALARLEPDGDLDPSFSGDGKVMTTFGGWDTGDAVAIQGDGKIVVAGTNESSGDNDFALARYNTDGSLDTSFSGDGKQTTGFGDDDYATGVVIQADGRIVAAGDTTAGDDLDIALARYNANGSLDPGFDGDGKVITNLDGHEVVRAATIQSNGKVIVAGGTNGCGDSDLLLARYNTDGSEDSSFEGGALCTDFGGYERAFAVAIQPDSKIVAAGCTACTGGDFALARYNANGSLDTSFSGDGKQRTGFGGSDGASGVAIQADGRIVAAGYTTAGGDYDFALARYHAITDNTPPNTTITSGPSGSVNSTTATFAFVSSEPASRFQCSLDGAAYSGCSSPKSYSNLNDGSHLFGVRAIDAAGNTDPSAAQRSFTVDTRAPRVNDVVPAEDATGVAPAVNVKATFSEAMSASSITTDTVKLFRAGTTTPIAAVVSYETQTKTATLNPDIDLRLGTRYKAAVTTGTRDLAGNQLDQDATLSGNQSKRWFFTIGN